MRSMLILLSFLLSATAGGQEPERKPSDRDRAVAFLKKHVIGKTVNLPDAIFDYDAGKVEGVGSSADSFTNLVETDDGFKFDVLSSSKLTNFDLDKDGKRILPGRKEDATYLSRYELTTRRSTGKLVGTCRIVSSNHKTFTAGYTNAVLWEVEDDGLKSREQSLFYEDFFAAKGKWKPGASESRFHFHVEEGKLCIDAENLQFDVNPETLERTLSSTEPTRWSSREN